MYNKVIYGYIDDATSLGNLYDELMRLILIEELKKDSISEDIPLQAEISN